MPSPWTRIFLLLLLPSMISCTTITLEEFLEVKDLTPSAKNSGAIPKRDVRLSPLPKKVSGEANANAAVISYRTDTTRLKALPLSISATTATDSGVSRQKIRASAIQQGVKIENGEGSGGGNSSNDKRRSEGIIKLSSVGRVVVHSGRIGAASPKISERFFLPSPATTTNQVQVEPASPPLEENHPLQDLDLITPNNSSQTSLRFRLADSHRRRALLLPSTAVRAHHGDAGSGSTRKPSAELEADLLKRPAFCRRCFRFWKSVAAQHVTNEMILSYCCTLGSNKGRIFLHTTANKGE